MPINELWHKSFSNAEVDNKLGEMAAKFAIHNFDYLYATLLLFNTTLYDGVELFLQVFNYNIIVNRGAINPKLTNITRQYVIFTSDDIEFTLMLDTLNELQIKNTGKFIIVCQSLEFSDCDEEEMTKQLWEHKIVDVVVIKSEDEEVLGFTYFPISDGGCNNVKPIQLNLSDRSQYYTTSHGNIFSLKLRKLSFCPLFVSTFIQTPYMKIINGIPFGADGDLLRIIAYGLNTSVVMRTPRHGEGWGYRQKNGTWAGSLGDLNENLANISMTSGALTLTRFTDFQLSRGYYTICVVWIAHPPMLQNEATKLLHPFGPSTRIALMASYILVILCAFVLKTKKWQSICQILQEDQPTRSIVFYSWMICMGQAVIKLPTKPAFLQIIIFWIFYGLIIRTAYQVYLISSLKGIFHEDPFETIEDVVKANYPYGGGPALREYFIDYPLIYDNWINIDAADIVPTALNISKGKKFVLAMNMDTAKVVIKKHKVKLHILPQKIVCTPTVIFAKKYSPLMESISRILRRLVTAGLPEKIHKTYTSIKNMELGTKNEQERLNLNHLTACYLILILGAMISIVFFSLEIYFGKIYKHPVL